jgi:S-adenosylmethionine synthetase
MNMKFDTYSMESVTAGHPDKVCDQISDAILDVCLKEDPMSRVAIETFGGHNLLVIGGEITSNANVDYEKIGREVYKLIGYEDKLDVITRVVKQSNDIAIGVNTGGAGDQGIMYGYATDMTEDYLPFGVGLVHKLTKGLQELRENKVFDWLMPDGKAQLTIHGGNKVQTVLVSTQHKAEVDQKTVRKGIIEKLIRPVIGDIKDEHILVNPTGAFVQGGFSADTGLTGRKIMVDTYGGMFPHGGGCFSGKDATKVDRSGAYMCRFTAKNIVANGYAKECLVSVAYAIGKAEPLMVNAVNEKGEHIDPALLQKFDFRPLAIIERLGLRNPIFQITASNGHFTNKDFPWEKIIKM